MGLWQWWLTACLQLPCHGINVVEFPLPPSELIMDAWKMRLSTTTITSPSSMKLVKGVLDMIALYFIFRCSSCFIAIHSTIIYLSAFLLAGKAKKRKPMFEPRRHPFRAQCHGSSPNGGIWYNMGIWPGTRSDQIQYEIHFISTWWYLFSKSSGWKMYPSELQLCVKTAILDSRPYIVLVTESLEWSIVTVCVASTQQFTYELWSQITVNIIISWFLVIILQTAPLSGANIGVWHRAHALGAERDLQ